MRILLTNDDGIESPGLKALYEAIVGLPGVELEIMAPDRNWSIAGHNKTMDRPLRFNEIEWHNGQIAYTTDGSPSDCVALAALGVIPAVPELVLSGINLGPNLGDDVTYSGTVAAAMEAYISGIPGVAFSLNEYVDFNFDAASKFAARLVSLFILGEADKPGGIKLTRDLLLNVNVPNLDFSDISGIMFTRQGRRIYKDELFRRTDPRGRNYFWIGGERPAGDRVDGTDIAAVENGYISVTPLMLDLTNHLMMEKVKEWRF